MDDLDMDAEVCGPSFMIYKYLPRARETFFTDGGLLRFTQPSQLNDPFECRPRLSFEILGALFNMHVGPSAVHIANSRRHLDAEENYQKLIANRLDRDIGILSLSKRWDSSLMWSHYGEGHRGFALGFDRRHSFFAGNAVQHGSIARLQDVSYSKYRELAVPRLISDQEALSLFKTKSDEWAYEEEVRLIRPARESVSQINGPENSIIRLHAVPTDAVREICIGARAPRFLRDGLISHGLRLEIPTYELIPSGYQFSMRRLRVNPAPGESG